MDDRTQKTLIAALSGLILVGLVVLGGMVFGIFGSPKPTTHILMVGNSFTAHNNLDVTTAKLIEQTSDTRVEVQTVAPDGMRFSGHADSLSDPTSELSQAFENEWDIVIFQEQSQIGGFPASYPDRQDSMNGARALVDAVNADRVIFFMTWGYREGDDMNPDIYGSYNSMQDALTNGYQVYANSFGGELAPAGLGFQGVFLDASAGGISPITEGTIFWNLYANDGQHPSQSGSYLAAAIIAATVTGEPVSTATYAPVGLQVDLAATMRKVADRVVFSQ